MTEQTDNYQSIDIQPMRRLMSIVYLKLIIRSFNQWQSQWKLDGTNQFYWLANPQGQRYDVLQTNSIWKTSYFRFDRLFSFRPGK